MSAITRREFLQKTATDAALAGFFAAGATRAFASPLGLPIGSQTYPHRDRIVKGDFAGLLKDMKGIGIEVIDATCEVLVGTGLPLKLETPPQGAAATKSHGTPLPEETKRAAREAVGVAK